MSFFELPSPPRTARAGGLGASTEIPDVGPLPWQLDVDETRGEKAWSRMEQIGSVVGFVGGILGLVLAYRALKGR